MPLGGVRTALNIERGMEMLRGSMAEGGAIVTDGDAGAAEN